MNWPDFRELPPLERRKCRRTRSQGVKAQWRFVEKAFRRLPYGDFDKFPDVGRAAGILMAYKNLTDYKQFVEWLNWSVPVGNGWTRKAPTELLIIGQQYPEAIFGFFDDANFVPGILPLLMMHPRLYTDPLDDILSEEELSGMIVDEVVAMAHKRGMKSCNNDLVRKRVQDWDRKKTEISPKKSHTR